jgi:uncharacterized protein involved in exopolysaccharide biosynthesis
VSQLSPVSEAQPSLELAHYLGVVRQRAWVVLLAAMLGLLGALAYVTATERTVTAMTIVDINLISSDPFNTTRSPAELIDQVTETQTATSSTVLREVATSLGGVRPSEVKARTDAELMSDATIMRISYTASSTAKAEAGADAVASAYLAYRSQQADARATAIVDNLTQRREALRDELLRLNSAINAARPNSPRAVQAESDRQLVNVELNSLSAQISSFLGLETTGGQVLSQAAENPTTVTPSTLRVVLGGAAGGALLGLVAAFVLAAVDRRVRDGRALSRLGAGPVLGQIPSPRLLVPAADADRDAVRALRERLRATMTGRPTAVTVVDLSTDDGIPAVAANLAEAFSEAGDRINLVLAHAPGDVAGDLASALGLSPAPGGTDEGTRYERVSGGGDGGFSMTVPPAGRSFLTKPSEYSDADPDQVTIVAVPSGAPTSVLLGAARAVPAVLLVVTGSKTRKSTVSRVCQELASVGARVHGTVLTHRRRLRDR